MSELEVREAMKGLRMSANSIRSAEKVAEGFRADFKTVGKHYRDAMSDIRRQMELDLNPPSNAKDSRGVFGESEWKSNRIIEGGETRYDLFSGVSVLPVSVVSDLSASCSLRAVLTASFKIAPCACVSLRRRFSSITFFSFNFLTSTGTRIIKPNNTAMKVEKRSILIGKG